MAFVALDKRADLIVGRIHIAGAVFVVQLWFETVVFDVRYQRVAGQLVGQLRGARRVIAQRGDAQLFKRFVLRIRAKGQRAVSAGVAHGRGFLRQRCHRGAAEDGRYGKSNRTCANLV